MIPRSRYAQIPSLPVLCFDIAVPVFLFFNVEPPELSEEGVQRTVCEGNTNCSQCDREQPSIMYHVS